MNGDTTMTYSPTPTSQSDETAFAWCIEHADSEPSRPRYFTGKRHPAMQWSDPGDHAEALRMARKEDAERVASFAGFYEPNPTHRICEHGWMGRAPSAPAPKAAAEAWIPCGERMPETETPVLTYVLQSGYYVYQVDQLTEDGDWLEQISSFQKVTHWQPLPASPVSPVAGGEEKP
jgi:hypothetical protein